MSRNHAKRAIFFLFLLSVLATAVSAQNLFEDITEPFEDFDLAEAYADPGRAFFIDLVIYAIIFIGVATYGLSKQFGGRNVLPVTIGIILAAAMSMGAQRINFRLLDQGLPFAVVVFVLFFGITLYRLFTNQGISKSWTIVILYLIIITTDLNDFLRELHPVMDNFIGFMAIAAIVAGFFIVKDLRGGGLPGLLGFGGGQQAAQAVQQGARQAQQAAQQAQQQQQQAALLQQHTQLYNQLNQQLGRLQQAVAQGVQNQAHLVQQLGGAINQLQQIDNKIIQLMQQKGP